MRRPLIIAAALLVSGCGATLKAAEISKKPRAVKAVAVKPEPKADIKPEPPKEEVKPAEPCAAPIVPAAPPVTLAAPADIVAPETKPEDKSILQQVVDKAKKAFNTLGGQK
jgi:hypothetical protein